MDLHRDEAIAAIGNHHPRHASQTIGDMGRIVKVTQLFTVARQWMGWDGWVLCMASMSIGMGLFAIELGFTKEHSEEKSRAHAWGVGTETGTGTARQH